MGLAVVAGLLTGLSLIVAIGAQNAFVLRQGLLRRDVGAVVAVCAVSDLALIAAGTAGMGALVERAGALLTVVRIAGAAFLVAYGVRSLRHARHAEGLEAARAAPADRRRSVLTAFALTWLNPHVYLDTLLLLGTVAATHGDLRWAFAAGAMTASVLWFTGLGYGSRLLERPLSSARAWQILDVVIGLTMIAIAASLLLGA